MRTTCWFNRRLWRGHEWRSHRIDFRTAEWPVDSVLEFTCFWKRDQRWQGRTWQVSLL
jgi:hypothetical protein